MHMKLSSVPLFTLVPNRNIVQVFQYCAKFSTNKNQIIFEINKPIKIYMLLVFEELIVRR